ncbi:hypothetical protein MKW98_019772 [Papaver atlanticum]|uniref:Uncharacterized protein n=1 Tax=Papaver atlanticum TaxID=357466 RepID=A0AAD4TCW5_9MAGN|nr:hypothetical protein MKW98_019772 [Papaver atlanticum]
MRDLTFLTFCFSSSWCHRKLFGHTIAWVRDTSVTTKYKIQSCNGCGICGSYGVDKWGQFVINSLVDEAKLPFKDFHKMDYPMRQCASFTKPLLLYVCNWKLQVDI